jgi:purine-nucleoside phosphorylase
MCLKIYKCRCIYCENFIRFGPRFLPMGNAYDSKLVMLAGKLAKEMGMQNETHTGVYTCLGGPNYETVAELRMLRILGVDAVGMSTVHEVVTARHCNMKVFAFSLITNKCETDYESHEEANHDSIVEIASKKQESIANFVTEMVKRIDQNVM